MMVPATVPLDESTPDLRRRAAVVAAHPQVEWGFNKWIKAQTGQPSGRDWQTWSVAMCLYAVDCVERQGTPFFGEIRAGEPNRVG